MIRTEKPFPARALATTGIAKFTWEVQGGKLQANFRLPDPNISYNQVLAFVAIPGGLPNRFYLLL